MKGTPTRETTYMAIKMACRFRRLSQDEVARRVGLDPAAFSRIIHGKSIPSVHVALKLADVLGFTVEELFPDAEGLLFPAGAVAGPGRPKKGSPTP